MQKEASPAEKTIIALVTGIGLIVLSPMTNAQSSYFLTRVLGPRLQLVGHNLNGVSLNGAVLDSARITSISATDVELDGELLEQAWIRDSALVGTANNGHFIPPKKMIGATLQAKLDNGETLSLHVESLKRSSEHLNRDTYLYQISYESAAGELPLCGVDEAGTPIAAIALAGRWDYSEGTETGGSHIDDDTAITFACRGYVLAKCVEAGYKPWKRARVCSEGGGCHFTTLAAHHQACTRMLRADYCGDGTSHTTDAVPVNLYDGYSVRYDAVDWLTEAEWDEDGAICAVTERIAGDAPQCVDWLSDPECGSLSHFADGALLISEIAPPVN